MNDIEKAKAGLGTWVKNSAMSPMANVAGRVYRNVAGEIGVYYCGSVPGFTIDAWFYPDSAGESGAGDETASCPAIKSFKTVSEYRLAAGKSKIQALVFASVCAGASFATAVAGFATYMLGADPDYQLASIAAIAVGGLGAIFTAANADGQLKDAMRRIEGDTRITYELKVHARALEDKVSDLRAALNDAHGAGEAAGERGSSPSASPAATVHGINAKTARRFQ